MSTQFATAITPEKDSFKAGKEVAQKAWDKLAIKKADIAVIFCSSSHNYEEVIKGFKSIVGEIPIVGCSSAGEFTEEKETKGGLACALISSDTHRFFLGMGKNLQQNQIHAVQNASKNFPHQVQGYPYQSAMLFLDGLAGKGEETVLAASSVLGPAVKFSGGAASDNYNFKQTFVFGDNQMLSYAVSICFVASQKPVIITAKHGHKPLSPPLKVTKAKGNVLYEVEGKPALDVWKYYLKDKTKELGIDLEKTKSPEELSKVLLKHEAGLMIGDDYKLRFPTSANSDGSLNFVSTITDGSVFKIMNSEDKDQIESAKIAAEKAIEGSRGERIAGAVVFDCACRSMLLKNKFPQALAEIKKALGNIPMIGFETYGEVAMEHGELSGFHNATTVILLFPS